MTVKSTLFLAISALVAGRVYPVIAPHGTARPYVTYQQVGGVPVNFLDSAIPSMGNAKVQINVWSDTQIAADVLISQIETALRNETLLRTTVLSQPADTYEADTQLFGVRQDFSFWQ